MNEWGGWTFPLKKVPEVDLGLRYGRERWRENEQNLISSFKKDIPVDMRNEMRLRDCWFVELWDRSVLGLVLVF